MTAVAHAVPANSRATATLGNSQAVLCLFFQIRLIAAAAAMLNTGRTGSKKRTYKLQHIQPLL